MKSKVTELHVGYRALCSCLLFLLLVRLGLLGRGRLDSAKSNSIVIILNSAVGVLVVVLVRRTIEKVLSGQGEHVRVVLVLKMKSKVTELHVGYKLIGLKHVRNHLRVQHALLAEISEQGTNVVVKLGHIELEPSESIR